MTTPTLQPSIRRLINAVIAELEAAQAIAAAAACHRTTVQRAYKPVTCVDATEPSGALLLATLVEVARLGRPEVVGEVLRRAGLDGAELYVRDSTDDGPRSCAGVADAALRACGEIGRVAALVREHITDGRYDDVEVTELLRAREDVDAALRMLVERARGAAARTRH